MATDCYIAKVNEDETLEIVSKKIKTTDDIAWAVNKNDNILVTDKLVLVAQIPIEMWQEGNLKKIKLLKDVAGSN